jgi:subtilisin family serine protease
MTQNYAVLWRPVRRQLEAGEVDISGRFGGEDSASQDDAPRLSVSQLDPNEAAEIAAAPDVVAVAPQMATHLIVPHSADVHEESNDGLWGIAAVGAAKASYSGKGVRVAVLDTGIEASHSAFSGKSIIEKDFSGSGNGDKNGHGTHCAGTLFGGEVGGVRIGIAPDVERAFIGKVLTDDGSGSSMMIFEGLRWAIDQRADIISMSLGLNFPGQVQQRIQQGWPADLATSLALEEYRKNTTMFEAIMQLARAGRAFGNDPLIVAAAGNESRRNVNAGYRIGTSLPAVVCDVAVGAVARAKGSVLVAPFSNCNPDLVAPGVNIKSAWVGGGTRNLSGTSMACPHVAGVAALWVESLRGGGKCSGSTIRSHLIATARRDMFSPGADRLDIGQGMITAP